MPHPSVEAMASDADSVVILYRNWRGETGPRHIRLELDDRGDPMFIMGVTEWHPVRGVLFSAFDIDKGAHRQFALSGVLAWGQEAVDAALTPAAGPVTVPEGLEGPVAWVVPGDDNANVNGFIDAKCCREGEFTRPLYALASPPPSGRADTPPGGGERDEWGERYGTGPGWTTPHDSPVSPKVEAAARRIAARRAGGAYADAPGVSEAAWRSEIHSAEAALFGNAPPAGGGAVDGDFWINWRGAVEGYEQSKSVAATAIGQALKLRGDACADAATNACWAIGLDHLWKHVQALRAARAAAPEPAAGGGREIVRHLKRGTEYEVLHQGVELQVSRTELLGPDRFLFEGARLIVYRGADGRLWAREEGEFRDGRFETVTEARSILSAPTEAGDAGGDGWIKGPPPSDPDFYTDLPDATDEGLGWALSVDEDTVLWLLWWEATETGSRVAWHRSPPAGPLALPDPTPADTGAEGGQA